MKPYLRFAYLLFVLFATVTLQAQNKLEGRWNLVIEKDGQQLPSWLEIEHSGTKTLVGRFVYAFGSARPISVVNVTNEKFNFSIPPQWEPGDRNMDFEGELTGETLKGTMIYTDGKKYNWTATRAPLLKRNAEPVWGKPITLFNGKDLKGWKAMGPNQWIVENGILRSLKSGSNLVSEQTFTDFKLHIEFRYEKGSNSGVYLRGRYEVQIEDDKGKEPWKGYLGAVYGFLTPSMMVAKDAGEWQSYDITLVGRMITVVANGVTIISNQEIPGITGGAIDNNESEPGPIMLQGDHGPIDYRNIVITPAK
ncbi:MAG: large multifunctional protein- glycosyl hydrolase [Bacteroidota bacterium]|nr:MAG: cycloisomaltooligosaccharide glucanotransferase [Bacteroidetes bacterium OLB12]GIL23469.1 MAG: large multifunctional protein- glycosyl hydrolase [Bacteroidota bacterium]HNR73141.1 DUF1080 domain-containing protein [Cyclobacteriaceae bacterium]